ncbi:hypothetical protein [Thiorhodococcus minor]|uniref:Uncharacterized protein n=1 Tax=Thiorhodococcus minor TaxID=57489 RepID=A0A6M0JTM5_9GAMM|nr:hypothetical protein [Thiorhodococcus minor]NEV60822.1 hypothetical protein [Thiorhodococcus minor]
MLLTSCLLGSLSAAAWSADPGFLTTHFSGSANCAFCHNGLTDSQGKDVSIERDWSGTLMANASRDPFWKAKVATELARNPHLADVINKKCTLCHGPMGNYEAEYDRAAILALEPGGLLDPTNPYHDPTMDGVSCTLCHQIQDDPTLGTLDGFSGHYSINPFKDAYGQYQSPRINPMLRNSGYTPVASTHISDSAVCSTCHNLYTPFVDAQGVVQPTEFPEQMVYTEWENSDYAAGATAQSCQDCHMPKTNGVKIANRPRNLPRRNNFSQHHLVGANAVILNLIDENAAELGVLSTTIPTSVARSRAMLESAAAIDVVSTSLLNETLSIDLRLRNLSGHKVPTSYPSRRAILHVTVRDAQGQIVFESGRVNADGSVVGVDADTNIATFEPHYDLITSEDQVQVYESIMGNTDDEVTYTLLRGSQYLKDNRLTPAGFDKAVVASDIGVFGNAASDGNFNRGEDLITYQVSGVEPGSYQVSVELVYQPIQFAFLLDLLQDVGLPEVADFQRMYDATASRSDVMATAATTVTVGG